VAHFLVEYAETGKAAQREALRPDHIAYRKGLGDALRLAGHCWTMAGSRGQRGDYRRTGSGGGGNAGECRSLCCGRGAATGIGPRLPYRRARPPG
jgi:hypothetical protein